ncbi:5-oxoprolinase subunit PxpB [Paraburkholderia caballeronis]|uniref:Sensor histidine kinase inhibitor, KipI family n=1 Tax=Paraburkholderia caballeronis TaxID=416943 RepID=A0A1H7SKQ3_9BURK|nr:5-oxoprolinase subunit PxpB [Paraburkholderia caballeronis]PXW22328.1 KipI family sensor histidine kinase inhibitor [Paraburkholderia caballeronis]PXW95986.1 KipI family sensor histidine kinase inhibitor [Paraburkholderia caballeronis]RAJ92352.1 KipI family sensor histidine kinase inhibitor [Paraburkholderia caballeronis]TDV08103.1 KipI family sensor histidine kinase inhibitor [Paraburkholderia caballeronis]TDV11833.1 KipI family sensor histidine kinase inhibitor [Paraburkholderia caballero
MTTRSIRIYPLGDEALVCESPPPATLDVQRRVWAVAALARGWPPVRDVVPGMNNLTITFDPLAADVDALAAQLAAAWREADDAPAAGRDVDIPVEYGGAFGPDLDVVAKHTGLAAREVVERHAAGAYVVFFVGFQPGFAYMGGLEAALHTPRRREPRLAVPAGSVGIGGEQTGIYPAASPGGWQLIGRTSLALFDPAHNPPTLLLPGDRVRFTIAGIHS